MRSEKALKNMLSSLFSYVLFFVFGIILRKVLLNTFETELIGYEGIVADMFSFIALADFGLDGLFNYRLYEAFAKDDKNRLNKLATMYKYLWNGLGILVGIICLVLFFLLPTIFAGRISNWFVFRTTFVLYAISALSTYFFGYWRTILTAAQQEHKAITIETITNFIAFVVKLLTLIFTKNIILYLIANISFNVLNKVLVYFVSKKQLSEIRFSQTNLDEFKKEGMIDECKQLMVIKAADVVDWSSANLFISLLLNVNTATFYSNYAIIGNAVWSAVSKFIRPLRATLADLLYKEDKDVSYAFFNTMDLFCFTVASIIFVCYTNVFQPTISIIYGEEYLLPNMFVFVYALLFYFAAKSETINSFRECFGDYKQESILSLISIVVAIVLSIILSKVYGVAGIVIATIVSYLIIWHSRKLIVIKKFYNKSIYQSWISEILFLILAVIENYLVFIITKNIPFTIIGLLLRCVIGVLIPLIINAVVFFKTDAFKSLINMLNNILLSLRK